LKEKNSAFFSTREKGAVVPKEIPQIKQETTAAAEPSTCGKIGPVRDVLETDSLLVSPRLVDGSTARSRRTLREAKGAPIATKV